MKTRIAIGLATSALILSASALAPSAAALGTLPSADAAVSKSLVGESGGGNVSATGTRLGGLLSGVAVPVITALAGCMLIGALVSRNIGTGVGIVVITIIGLIFLLSPQSVETFAKGIANVVF